MLRGEIDLIYKITDKTMTENLTRKFQQLQEERTKTFHQLDEDHKVFLSTAPEYENGFDDYKKAVNESTERFKFISKEIIRIRETLEQDPTAAKIASLIGKVQELEENKLRIVCDLQLARFVIVHQVQFECISIVDNKPWTILVMISARRTQI